jgi:hypothetical protein
LQRTGINRDDSVFVRELIETGQPLHVISILIHSMQQNHHGIFPRLVVSSGQTHLVCALNIIDGYLFLGFLCQRGRHGKENRKANPGG